MGAAVVAPARLLAPPRLTPLPHWLARHLPEVARAGCPPTRVRAWKSLLGWAGLPSSAHLKHGLQQATPHCTWCMGQAAPQCQHRAPAQAHGAYRAAALLPCSGHGTGRRWRCLVVLLHKQRAGQKTGCASTCAGLLAPLPACSPLESGPRPLLVHPALMQPCQCGPPPPPNKPILQMRLFRSLGATARRQSTAPASRRACSRAPTFPAHPPQTPTPGAATPAAPSPRRRASGA
jgi:hypothetical protein